MVELRTALVLALTACAPKESASVTSSSAEQAAASALPTASSASASAAPSTMAPVDPAVERAWRVVRAACPGGAFVSQPFFDPQLGGKAGFSYYRFYEDGVVVEAIVMESEPGQDRAETNAKVLRWLTPDNHKNSKGTYRLDGDKIVAELESNFGGHVRFSVGADFRKAPFLMKTVANNGHTETKKYACPL